MSDLTNGAGGPTNKQLGILPGQRILWWKYDDANDFVPMAGVYVKESDAFTDACYVDLDEGNPYGKGLLHVWCSHVELHPEELEKMAALAIAEGKATRQVEASLEGATVEGLLSAIIASLEED
jgi:hypothetical protein